MTFIDGDGLPSGSVPHIDFFAITSRCQTQSFGRPGNREDLRQPIHFFGEPGMTAIRE